MSHQQTVNGNRLALIGVFWYLLEFAAIALFFEKIPPGGSSAAEYAAYYAANHATLPLYVVGVCAAILGRLAFTSGLRCAFHQFEESAPLLDLAYATSIVSVTVEIVGLGMIVMALSMAGSGMENASLACSPPRFKLRRRRSRRSSAYPLFRRQSPAHGP